LLQQQSSFSRMTFRLSRFLVTPPQALAQVVGSLALLCAFRKIKSARLAFRAARSAGLFSRLCFWETNRD
jgi:hypothetical protein